MLAHPPESEGRAGDLLVIEKRAVATIHGVSSRNGRFYTLSRCHVVACCSALDPPRSASSWSTLLTSSTRDALGRFRHFLTYANPSLWSQPDSTPPTVRFFPFREQTLIKVSFSVTFNMAQR